MKFFLLLQADRLENIEVALNSLVCLQLLIKDFFLSLKGELNLLLEPLIVVAQLHHTGLKVHRLRSQDSRGRIIALGYVIELLSR